MITFIMKFDFINSFISGPVVGIFGQKYGVRPIILAGGVLGTLSTVACFFVTDIIWTTVFWGFFSGK